ncbi:MAG: citrate (pro-3S)-lyase [Nocardia sp.]|uniref:HpcH/HpaI aldolase/citrate lyase family protein n=1 Tax=Nocardia sp. TaxID=1821 RepID=UPI0026119ACA|nr:CoA ester lyase [Nocardia sp.]MCU1640701.1 citrate (pro-3S)-lyase [Nocardia sp.]
MQSSDWQAIRCLVSVPASRPALIAKAMATNADAVLIDLEDAVAPGDKDTARLALADIAGAKPTVVRVNAARTPWCHQDVLACAMPGGPDAIMLPKVEQSGDLEFLDRLLSGAEAASDRTTPLTVLALIESATGLANVREIARASNRTGALVLGYADLGASLGRSANLGASRWLYAQEAMLTAARSAGLAAIDGPHLGVAVDDEFLAGVEHSVALGFDGKWVIHPRQIDTVTAAFTPSAAAVDEAQAIIDALTAAHESHRGAVTVGGRMIDEALAVSARRLLARAHYGRA